MTIRPITIYGEPVLHESAEPVAQITDEVRELVRDMYETMDAAPGVGLAAPQLGVGARVFVYGWEDEDGTTHRGEAINPTLWLAPETPESIEPVTDDEDEGCLSFPGERFPLRRSPRVLLEATNLEGEQYRLEADGWLARILQHEFDHLNGVIYVDRLPLPLHKQARKLLRKHHWGVPGCSWQPGVDNLEG